MSIEEGKIGTHQFTILIVLFTIGSTIMVSPTKLAAIAKQDAWIAAITGLVIGLLLVVLYNAIAARFPNKTLVHYSQEVLGKWLGKIISFFYFCYFFLMSTLIVRHVGEFTSTEILPNTPIHIVHILFLLVLISGLRHGIEVFARSAEIFFLWMVFFFLLLAVLLPPQFELGRLLPVLGYGIKPVLQATPAILANPYMELVTFLMILPFVRNSQKARKAFFVGVSIGGIMLILVALWCILILGADLTSRLLFPGYTLAQKISIGHFIERLEVLMAAVWFITIYFKLAVCFYVATITFAELFKLKEARQLYFPFGMIMIVLSIAIAPSMSYYLDFISKYYFLYSVPYAVIIPLLILIVAIIRKQKAV